MHQTPTQTAKVTAIRIKTSNRHIFRAFLSLSLAALFVRITGMLNQVVVSTQFGAMAVMDAHFLSYTLPTLVIYLIVGAIKAAVIPVYSCIRPQWTNKQSMEIAVIYCYLIHQQPFKVV